jgi:heme/copper-type cytochrome/quinol oxidase subunit 3
MDEGTEATETSDPTASDLKRTTRSSNRMVLWILLCVAGLFFATAFGVAILVKYGPY